MKKATIIIFGILLIFNAQAQKFTTGLQLNYIHYTIIGSTDRSYGTNKSPYWEKLEDTKAGGLNINGTFGYNPIFYKFNDKLSIGASLNIGLGYILTPKLAGLNGSVVVDFPEYLTLRYKKKVTQKSDENVMYSFGAGYDYSYNRLPIKGPSIMAELRLQRYAFRLNMNLLKHTYYYYYTSEGTKPAMYLRLIGMQVLIEI
ncbi:MAG: hypothetical protein V4608_16255 [Bacteroidota bacterium]